MSKKEKANYYARKKLGVNNFGKNTPYTRSRGWVNSALRKKAADLIRKTRHKAAKMSFSSITRMK